MNNYQIYDEVGKGRYSIVYKGRLKKSIDYYAVSSIDKSQRQRVQTNVRFLRTANHPHVIKFHNWYETNNHLWVVTELCTGGDLRQVLHPENHLSEAAVRLYGGDIAEGLMYIHMCGVVYRDLKPSSILMDSTMTMRFYNFGISCAFPVSSGEGTVGTARYMAPELFTKEGVPSMASDLWSFGCLLLEMRSGKPPFDAPDLETLIPSILTEPYEPHEDLSDDLNELLKMLLVKDPLKRATWEDVVACPFWQGRLQLPENPFPPQPAFDKMKKRATQGGEGKGGQGWPMSSEDVKKAVEWVVETATRNHILLQSLSDGTTFIGPGVNDEIDTTDHSGKCEVATDRTPMVADDNPSASPASRGVPAGENTCVGWRGTDLPHHPSKQAGDRKKEGVGAEKDPDAGHSKKDNARQPAVCGKLSTSLIGNLLSHQSDAHVRPLVMNSRIERFVEQKYDTKALGFDPLTKTELKGCDEQQKAHFVTTLYKRLSSSSTTYEEKLNILCYFEAVCADSSIANFVVNSSVMTLCLKMAGHRKAPSTFRATAASIMGILVRHATFIHHDLAKINILASILKACVEEESTRVRRKLVACFGEFLIYICVQQERDRAAWGVDIPATFNVYKAILEDADDVLKHYGIKTIENLASMSDHKIALDAFTNPETISLLLTVYSSPCTQTCTDYMRTGAICTALKLTMLREELMPIFLDSTHVNLEEFGDVFTTMGNTKLVQTLLTFMNMALIKSLVGLRHPGLAELGKPDSTSPFASSALTGDEARGVLAKVIGVAELALRGLCSGSEHMSAAIKGKTLMLLVLLGCADPHLLVRLLSSSRLAAHVDSIARDKDSYVQRSARALVSYLSALFSSQMAELVPGSSPQSVQCVSGALCNITKTKFLGSMLSFGDDVFANIGRCLALSFSSSRFAVAEANFHKLIENLAQNSEQVLKHRFTVTHEIIPPYLSMLKDTDVERRFLSLRILRALVAPLGDESALTAEEKQDEGERLDHLMQGVAEMLPELLKEEEPIPVQATGLLVTCGERRPKTFAAIATVDFIDSVVCCMTSSKHGSLRGLLQLLLLALRTERGAELISHLAKPGFFENLLKITTMAMERELDELLEPCCELATFILRQSVGDPNSTLVRQPFLMLAPRAVETLWLPLCTSPTEAISDSAAQSVFYFAKLSTKAQVEILSDEGIKHVREVMDRRRGHEAVVYIIRTLRFMCDQGRKGEMQKVMSWLPTILESIERDEKYGDAAAAEAQGLRELLCA
ncbi:unnamed protein product [Trypanosoma congolense IL3000]|uniref:WGS project CAEQ00000000 data, annotated contig 2217 n=1 Tax=Trypanosoma congolense (strain IL3000) TaxID=1068625 RepID=F9WCD7_TRYCI|nr:unnamed protein product [Trypanosoma congolense IL3000]